MNSDAYWRNQTSLRAFELNQVYQDLIANNTFNNFKMYYFDCPLEEVISIWKGKGQPVYELIEPVDGFHPTQIANAITTQVMFQYYEQYNMLPPINPNNNQIEKLFGNQGGYSKQD